jgi:hypothetical protein
VDIVFNPPTEQVTYCFPDFPALTFQQTEGLTVVVEGTTTYETKYPDSDRLALADAYYLGGYEHHISEYEAEVLSGNGYDDYLTVNP